MRTLKENTTNFIKEVKSTLDNAYWDCETSHPEKSNSDCVKSTDFLERQKFSIKTVKEQLKTDWNDIVEYTRDIRTTCNNCSWSNAELAAGFIAHELGFDRVTKRLSVSLPESIIFKIIIN